MVQMVNKRVECMAVWIAFHQGLCLEQVLEGKAGVMNGHLSTISCRHETQIRDREYSYFNLFSHAFIIVCLSTWQVVEKYASSSSGIASGRTRRGRKAGAKVTV